MTKLKSNWFRLTLATALLLAATVPFLMPQSSEAFGGANCEAFCDDRLVLDLYDCDTDYFFCLAGCPIPDPYCTSECNAALSQCQFYAYVRNNNCIAGCEGPNPGCV